MTKRKLIELANKFDIRRFIRFGVIGVINTVVDFGSFRVMTGFLGFNTYLAQTISYILATACGFILNKLWTFESRKTTVGPELGRYLILNVCYLAISNGLIWAFTTFAHMDAFIAKIPTAVILIAFNYIAQKFWVFKKQ